MWVNIYIYIYMCFIYIKTKPKCDQATTNVDFMHVYLRF